MELNVRIYLDGCSECECRKRAAALMLEGAANQLLSIPDDDLRHLAEAHGVKRLVLTVEYR